MKMKIKYSLCGFNRQLPLGVGFAIVVGSRLAFHCINGDTLSGISIHCGLFMFRISIGFGRFYDLEEYGNTH